MSNARANPGPLGLMGFGLTTLLLNIHNAGFFELDDAIIAMGLFYGGIAQLIAGRMEFAARNTFGATAFTSYGLFWLSLVYIVVAGNVDSLTVGNDAGFMGWYLFLWGLFTVVMFLGTLRKNRALRVVFASLAILFFLLAAGEWSGSETVTRIAGFEGILCGASAVYLAAAELLNETYRRTVLPVGDAAPGGLPPLEPTVPHPMEDLLFGSGD